MMNNFRLASRELFNHFYRVSEPYKNNGWEYLERFVRVEAELFQTLVVEPANLPEVRYGGLVSSIRVELRHGEIAPIMLNRGIDTGYWDYPVEEVTRDAELLFVRFFDWDQLDVMDYRYVRVKVENWPTLEAAVGKHALIETQYVCFAQQ